MKDNRFMLKAAISFIMAILISFSVLPSMAYSNENADTAEEPAPDIPFSFQYEKGDLLFSELEDAVLDPNEVPFVIGLPLATERDHVKRLYYQEPDDCTVLFQNRNGSKTIYYFSKPVKQSGRDLNSDEISSRVMNSESSVTISANRITLPANSILPMRLTQESSTRLYFYNIGYADVFEWSPDSRDMSFIDITKSVRDWSVSSEGEPSFDMISKSGDPVLLSGGGLIVMSINYSDLAGDWTVKTVPESSGVSAKYLKNSYPAGTNSISLTGSQTVPMTRWLIIYEYNRYMLRSQSNQLKYLTGDAISEDVYLQDYYDDPADVWDMERWDISIASLDDGKITLKNEYSLDSYLCHSGTWIHLKKASYIENNEHIWQLVNKNNNFVPLTGIVPQNLFESTTNGYFVPNYLLSGINNAAPSYSWLTLIDASNNQSLGFDEDNGIFFANSGLFSVYYVDLFTGIRSDYFFILNNCDIIDQSFKYSEKYVNINSTVAGQRKSLQYYQNNEYQNGSLIHNKGLSSTLVSSDGLSINQAFKLLPNNDGTYALSFVLPTEVNGVKNGHVSENVIQCNSSSGTIGQGSFSATNDYQKWYIFSLNGNYYLLNKGAKKLLGRTGSGVLKMAYLPSESLWSFNLTGIYKIKEYNSGNSNRYLSVQDDYDTEGNQIITNASQPTFHADRMVRIAYDFDNDGYAIYPVSSRNGYKKAVGINVNNNAVLSTYNDANISLNRKLFIPTYNSSNYWTFKCTYNSTMALAVDSNQNVKAVSYSSSATNQRWYIISDNETARQFKSEVYYKSLDISSPLPDLPTLSVTSDYGPRSEGSSNHYGVDLYSISSTYPYGYMLHSPCSGTIGQKGRRDLSGYYIVVTSNFLSYREGNEPQQQLYFYYCHLFGQDYDYQQLSLGDQITQGDSLGFTSNTDTGPDPNRLGIHLHMSVTTLSSGYSYSETKNIDPLMFFDHNEFN